MTRALGGSRGERGLVGEPRRDHEQDGHQADDAVAEPRLRRHGDVGVGAQGVLHGREDAFRGVRGPRHGVDVGPLVLHDLVLDAFGVGEVALIVGLRHHLHRGDLSVLDGDGHGHLTLESLAAAVIDAILLAGRDVADVVGLHGLVAVDGALGRLPLGHGAGNHLEGESVMGEGEGRKACYDGYQDKSPGDYG